MQEENWDWYFLMQHHGAPTRLLDWSDGALIALHFALRNKARDDSNDPVVYVLDPIRLRDNLTALPELSATKEQWKAYVLKHPSEDFTQDKWEDSYLPADETDLEELSIPKVPLLLDLPHITRRVAAQRSRFLVFGTDPSWLAEEFEKSDSAIRAIAIDARSTYKIRFELRDSGITESVIYPDLDGLGREMQQLWEDRK